MRGIDRDRGCVVLCDPINMSRIFSRSTPTRIYPLSSMPLCFRNIDGRRGGQTQTNSIVLSYRSTLDFGLHNLKLGIMTPANVIRIATC